MARLGEIPFLLFHPKNYFIFNFNPISPIETVATNISVAFLHSI